MGCEMGNQKYAGRGMYEFYMPTSANAEKQQRDRKRCTHYLADNQWCDKIFNKCVGPTMCKQYDESDRLKNVIVGKMVVSKYYGSGTVVSECDDFCTIQFHEKKIQCKKKYLKFIGGD